MVTMNAVTWVCLIIGMVAAYLLGSINFAILITRGIAKEDIRDHGSGNAGMTNVLRTLGKGPAAFTFLGDFVKGIFAILVVRALIHFVAKQPDFFVAEYLCAFCGLLGHCFPVFHKFKGGKGIAVSAGALITLSPAGFGICLAAFAVALLLTKMVSVGSIAAAITFPVILFVIRSVQGASSPPLHAAMAAVIAAMIIFMHRSNIKRLVRGEENKIGQKKKE